MPPNQKKGATCILRDLPRSPQGTGCLNQSPKPGVLNGHDGFLDAMLGVERKFACLLNLFSDRFFNAQTAANYVVKHARQHPMGLCARYSTAAITAGFGVPDTSVTPLLCVDGASSKYVELLAKRLSIAEIVGDLTSAKDYGVRVLTPLGFVSVASLAADKTRKTIKLPDGYTPEMGDVAIFQANEEIPHGQYGHMQLYTGKVPTPNDEPLWVSDGFQKTFLPNNDMAKCWQHASYSIYRFQALTLLTRPYIN